MCHDKDISRVGIDPVANEDTDKPGSTVSWSNSGGTIGQKAFLRRYDLVTEVTTQYNPSWDDEMPVVIDLNEPKKTYDFPDDEQNEAESQGDEEQVPRSLRPTIPSSTASGQHSTVDRRGVSHRRPVPCIRFRGPFTTSHNLDSRSGATPTQ